MSGFPPADVAELLGAEYKFSGWKRYIKVKNQENIQGLPDDVLTAYVNTNFINLNNTCKTIYQA